MQGRLNMGQRVADYLSEHPDIGRYKWREVVETCLHLRYTNAEGQRARRAYKFWLQHGAGQFTSAGAGVDNRRRVRSQTDGDRCRTKATAIISYELLQWFVDNIVALKCRADAMLLIEEAKRIADVLRASGTPDADIGVIDKHWLARWRHRHGIGILCITTRFKVSFDVACDRHRCYLGNVFRLRKLWSLCHPGVEMKWFSADQKPLHFNNAGTRPTYAKRGTRRVTVAEDHNATRERYSLFTTCQTWDGGGTPPKLAVLFKASRSAPILRGRIETPGFILLQFQEKGSYRSEDVCDALRFFLPAAQSSEESIVVILDWYSGHLTPEVQACIRELGHIAIYHGGGCTGFEQINDTHLHATVQRIMQELETKMHNKRRKDVPEKVTKFDRQEIVDIVTAMWRSIDHRNVSEVGYSQTGPTLPPDAGEEGVFKDMRAFWGAIDGDKLRREANDAVQALWDAGRLTCWADADQIIEHHMPHPACLEGLEGVEYDIGDADSDDDDSDDDGGGGGLGELDGPVVHAGHDPVGGEGVVDAGGV